MNPHGLWQVVGLDNDGIALMDKISHGLEGKVAHSISEWANITPSELRKMSGIPNTTFNRSVKPVSLRIRANVWCVLFASLNGL